MSQLHLSARRDGHSKEKPEGRRENVGSGASMRSALLLPYSTLPAFRCGRVHFCLFCSLQIRSRFLAPPASLFLFVPIPSLCGAFPPKRSIRAAWREKNDRYHPTHPFTSHDIRRSELQKVGSRLSIAIHSISPLSTPIVQALTAQHPSMAYQEWDDQEDFYEPRFRSPPRRPAYEPRRSQQFLDAGNGGGLFRTRSTGARPLPTINIFNDQIQDQHSRHTSPFPQPPPVAPQPIWQQPAPAPPQQIPVPVPQYVPFPVMQPEQRGRSPGRWEGELTEEMVRLALRDQIGRSRSRGRSELTDTTEFMRWQREQKEREIDEATRRQIWEKDNELKQIRADAKRKSDAAEAKEEQARVIRDYEDKKREEAQHARDEEVRIKDEMARKAAAAKAEEQRIKEKIERDAREAKEKKEREYEAFRLEEREKADKEAAAKKAKKEEFESEMRRRLVNLGYTQDQVDLIVDEEKAKKAREQSQNRRKTTTTTTTTLQTFDSNLRSPVFAKIHRQYLELDTLRYYNIPFEYDRTNSNYFIILREMDKYETDVLFEHTKRLRSGKLLLETSKDDKKYAWYRKRDRSSSRVRKIGILEFR
nr:hypothetical protein CFP56_62537 [Quercus suber]